MTINEKVAYLKGLIEGLDFKPETPEQKIIASIVDILDDISKTVTDIEDEVDDINDYVDEIDHDLSEVESIVYDDPDLPYGPYEDDDYLDDEDDDEFFDDEEDDEGDEIYEFECPECGEKIYFSEELADNDEIICPNCHKKLTFDAE